MHITMIHDDVCDKDKSEELKDKENQHNGRNLKLLDGIGTTFSRHVLILFYF